jgi:hypothetical protein
MEGKREEGAGVLETHVIFVPRCYLLSTFILPKETVVEINQSNPAISPENASKNISLPLLCK